MAKNPDDKSIIRIGARQLVETVYRSGGLSILSYHQLSGLTGTRTHQAFAAGLREEFLHFEVEHEYSLKHIWQEEDGAAARAAQLAGNAITGMEVNGRADVLLKPSADKRAVSFRHFDNEPDNPFIIEVKTVAGPLDQVPENGEEMHWLQAKLYSYMYWSEQSKQGADPPSVVPYALAYVSAETLDAAFKLREDSWSDLEDWFRETCLVYLTQARNLADWLEKRNESIRELRFPYSKLRDGQAELIHQVYESISRLTPLLAQAPTGTGKTMSVLFPAIKQLLKPAFEHVFYLTAKTSTRRAAEQALQDMRRESGLLLRSITLQAKESMCLAPELYCDTALCPYAVHYYDHLPDALRDLWPVQELNASLIMAAGESRQVCPFELSLDLALACDVIIGDYNHAFDPRIQLERFFGVGTSQHILLVDEAHNLVDRSREMYSATLDGADFFLLQSLFPSEHSRSARLTAQLCEYFLALQTAIEGGKDGWDELEKAPEGQDMRVLTQDKFRAINVPLRELAALLLPWMQHMREEIEHFQDARHRRKLVELIGTAKFFLRIVDEFWSPSYIACARVSPKGLAIRLICLDVSEMLSKTYINKHACVFFSATLSPVSYFSVNFCGRARDNRPDTLLLPSPFPPENLQVIVGDFISTIYKKRGESAADLAKAIALAILLKRGQQFVFFPSFAYLEQIMPLLEKMLSGQNIRWQIQSRHMNLLSREHFLKAFDHPDRGETVIGVAVLGGIFGEGIDLVGDKLSGVTIVGVGLPQLSPERNIMREYYDEVYQGGFLFAYLYPGLNKVLQAAGRLIRSEEDQGFLLLLDQRYGTPAYRELLPDEWEITEAKSLKELKALLAEGQNPGKN